MAQLRTEIKAERVHSTSDTAESRGASPRISSFGTPSNVQIFHSNIVRLCLESLFFQSLKFSFSLLVQKVESLTRLISIDRFLATRSLHEVS